MIVDNAKGAGKDFDPDPALDTDRQLEGRIQGIAHIGTIEKDEYVDGKKTGNTKEVDTVIISIEAVEEDTYVERGGEDNKYLTPRTFVLEERWSSAELANFCKLAKALVPKSVTKPNGKDPVVDSSALIGAPLSFQVREPNAKGNQYIDKKSVNPIPVKYQKDVPAATLPTHLFSVELGVFMDTDLTQVQPWILNKVINDVVNIDEIAEKPTNCIDQIEEALEAISAAKDSKSAGKELEGDRKPKAEKKAAKKEEPKEEPKAEEETKEEKPKRARRKAAKKEDAPAEDQFTSMSLEDLEDHLIEGGVSDDDLDAMAEEFPEDADYLEALKAKARSL